MKKESYFEVEKKCAYCKGELPQNAHPQTRGAWCCDTCYAKVMASIEEMKLKKLEG